MSDKNEHVDDQIDDEQIDDNGSDYGDADDFNDVNEDKEPKDEEDDDDEDDDSDKVIPKKKSHLYHQIPDSTEVRIVPASKRITSEYMTIFEYAMVVGTRATHISEGSVLYTDPDGLYDPRDIAKKEISENKCPLSITRKVSPSMVEIWEVNEMIKPQM
jgi:DNA-directed RNA polymerases I, II, and III subunit RPABC2